MWSDADSSVDYLNFADVASLVADLVSDKRLLPVSVGVFGGWGAGKSSLLRLIKSDLTGRGGAGSESAYVLVDFDAWLFQVYDDARASLLQVVGERLLDEV